MVENARRALSAKQACKVVAFRHAVPKRGLSKQAARGVPCATLSAAPHPSRDLSRASLATPTEPAAR